MASVAPLRIWRPSKLTPDMRVSALKVTNSASSAAMSRPRRLYFSLASTTIERPSGVSSASEDSCAASASVASSTPGAGMNAVAWRLPRVMVPVLSSSKTSTSPAASHGQHIVLHQTVHAGDADGGQQPSDRGGDETDQKRDQDKHGLGRTRIN